MTKVLVICPTFDHQDTLYASIASVRAQSFADWEMAVIGDGAPERTRLIVEALQNEDPRIRGVWHPKSERYGEIYRDPVIRESKSEFVCHLSDDDIWTPDHLDQMIKLLENAEWANQAPLRMLLDGKAEWWPINHGTQALRASIRRRVGVSAGINYVAYRRDAYLRLPEGWTCAPWEAGTSDVYMWCKFFQNPNLAVASSAVTSAIKFPSSVGIRAGRTPEQRMAEISPWLARAAEPGIADRLCRLGSIRNRMITLFALHGSGNCDSLTGAFETAGFQPVSAVTPAEPALNGESMRLPITPSQEREAHEAWTLVRAYCNGSGEDARRNLESLFAGSPGQWTAAVNAFASVAVVSEAVAAVRHLADALPDRPAPLALAAQVLRGAGREEEAEDYAARLRREWPDHPASRQR